MGGARGAAYRERLAQYHHRAAFINELASCLGKDEADLVLEHALGEVTGWS